MIRSLPLCALLMLAPLAFGAATALRLEAPAEVTRTEPFDVTITLLDSSGAVAADYTGTIRFAATPSGVVLPADYTFTPADNGTHTFELISNRGGEVLISASDVANGAIADNQRVKFLCPDLTVTASNSGPMCVYGGTSTVFAESSKPDATLSWGGPIRSWIVYGSEVTVDQTGAYHVNAWWNGCEAFAFTEVLAKEVTVPQVTLSATEACGGSDVIATLHNPSAYSTLTWSVDAGSIVSGQGTPSIVIRTPDTPMYGISVYLYTVDEISDCPNANGGNGPPVGFIRLHPAVHSPINVTPSACAGTTQTASTPLPSTPVQHEWSITNGTIVAEHFQSIEWRADGTGDVTITLATTNGGCTVTNTAVVAIGGPAAQTGGTFNACEGAQVDIPVTLSGVAPFSIVWSDGHRQDNITTNTATRTLTAQHTTTLSIASVTDANCTGVASGQAVIEVAGPSAHVDGRVTACAGESVDIPVALSGTAPFSIVWFDGVRQDNIMTNTATRTVIAEESRTYWIASVSDAHCSGIASGETGVIVADEPGITTQPRNTVVQRGQTATLTVDAIGSGLRFDWYRGATGDRSTRVQSGAARSYTTPPLTETTRYWVEVVSACGDAQSHTATVSIAGKRRPSR